MLCGLSLPEVQGWSVSLQGQSLVPTALVPQTLLSHLLFTVPEGASQPPTVPHAHPNCSLAVCHARPVRRGPGLAHVPSVLINERERKGTFPRGAPTTARCLHLESTAVLQQTRQEGGEAEHRGFGSAQTLLTP